MNSVLGLVRLTANVTVAGVTKKTLVRFTGGGAELTINLDNISICRLTMPNDFIDSTTTPYADASAATAALADQVIDCLIETSPASDLTNLTAAFAANQLDVTDAQSGAGNTFRTFAAAVHLDAGDLTFAYSLTLNNAAPGQVNAYLMDGDGNIIDSDTSTSLVGTLTLTVPDSGCYRVGWTSSETPGPGATTMSLSVAVANDGMTMGEIVALWDDGVSSGEVEC